MADSAEAAETYTIVPGTDEKRRPVFSVLLKRTYHIRPGKAAVRREIANPFVRTDIYYDQGDAETATVKYEADLVPCKAATDVVLVGKAYAPRGEPTPRMDVALEVEDRRKVMRVTGDRQCLYREGKPPQFTDPLPFTEMEIRYERAYGGKDLRSNTDLPFFYPRNPMGKGLALRNAPEVVSGLALPNLEDPEEMLTPERVLLGEPTRWNEQPLPQGFGWFQRTWYPRCSFVGSMPPFVSSDAVMREELLGIVPRGQIGLARQFKLPSFDVRFSNGASLGLAFPHLRGDEGIRLLGLMPEGELSFTLPGEKPRIVLDIGLGENELEVVLHTVCMRMEEMEVDLLWRGAHEYPGIDWLPQMKKMEAKVF